MAPTIAPGALLLLYLATLCRAEISAVAQPRMQSVIRQAPAERTLVRDASASTNHTGRHAWSAWGTWSACSRTCGGGVSVQERQCLPSDHNRWVRGRKRRRLQERPPGGGVEESKSPGTRTRGEDRRRREDTGRRRDASGGQLRRRVRETRRAADECKGLDRRYHECNTAPCRGPAREARAEQCASYDRRPFKGRFYTWVPYVDAGSPCTLNCRPRGQQFYASLALVADGTPCTRPGFRAICVQGACKVVGREGVLSTSTSRDPRCGRRLVSGLFTRPRLPLGYSHVATVPPGACRLNVSELLPSENYIALKLTNRSFIMNGEFAVSSPGTYEAAGAQFVYRRGAGVETIYTHGPTMHALDIMILYQHPNPSIKYEYLTDTLPEEEGPAAPGEAAPPARHHRHRPEPHTKSLDPPQPEPKPADARRFVWKIATFTQCSRSCGGGVQTGKFRCLEESSAREVAPAHCSGVAPAARRRRCNVAPCPPRWRTTPWAACPPCGPALQTRNVGCVQDHSRGITKISDSKCEPPMPTASQPCDIPNCESNAVPGEQPAGAREDTRRQVRERTERFHAASRPALSRPAAPAPPPPAANDVSAVLGPEYFSAAGGWLYTEWSECVGWCVGGGVRSRGVRCADPAGCSATQAPLAAQACTPRAACEPHTAHWFTGEWSACSAECGGRQIRSAVCLGGAGRRARDAACSEPRPQTERPCGADCRPAWYLSDWSQCSGACGAGVQSRTVWCARGEPAAAAAREAECAGARPAARRACEPSHCAGAAPAPSPPTRAPAPAPAPLPPAPPQLEAPRAQYYPPPQHTTPLTDPQRIPRNQNDNPRTSAFDDQRHTGVEGCTDRLSSCSLAVQARLCHYHYYTLYCCRSCHVKS